MIDCKAVAILKLAEGDDLGIGSWKTLVATLFSAAFF